MSNSDILAEGSKMSLDMSRSAKELRFLAAWYRDYAERAGNPVIWASRLTTAEQLEQEASALEEARPTPE
jgi:hypothetical protein